MLIGLFRFYLGRSKLVRSRLEQAAVGAYWELKSLAVGTPLELIPDPVACSVNDGKDDVRLSES